MRKERDIRIMKHIENYGFITIKQAHKIFFNERQTGYDLARKRLLKLLQQGYIKGYMDYYSDNAEKIYYLEEDYKMPSKHTILIMDSYAEMVNLGVNMLYFKREEKWKKTNRRSDAYAVFIIDDYLYEVFVEVQNNMSNGQSYKVQDMNKKYSDIFASGECEEKIKEITKSEGELDSCKSVLIVDPYNHKYEWEVDNERVVKVDYTFKGIGKILI